VLTVGAAPLVCTDDPGTGPAQGGQTATVNKNSDVYDAPEGKRLAAPFFLPAGRSCRCSNPAPTTGATWAAFPKPVVPAGSLGRGFLTVA
jgi:hypothetical protein